MLGSEENIKIYHYCNYIITYYYLYQKKKNLSQKRSNYILHKIFKCLDILLLECLDHNKKYLCVYIYTHTYTQI